MITTDFYSSISCLRYIFVILAIKITTSFRCFNICELNMTILRNLIPVYVTLIFRNVNAVIISCSYSMPICANVANFIFDEEKSQN